MAREIITGAEALMRALKDEGVKTIFGYPGGAIMPVYDALYDYACGDNKTFEHILVRHEQSAAHAAEGYARVSGGVGVCLVTSGPGVTNTLTGIADAMMDSTPIVVIAGQVGVSGLGTDAFQEVDLVGLARPVSKWSCQISSVEDVPWAVSRAFYIARSGRPGPVVLDFPKSVQQSRGEWRRRPAGAVSGYEPYPPLDMDAVRRAAGLINNARRPMALVGHGVELAGARRELVELIEKAGIPAAWTLMGLSALPSDHPLNVGMLGMHGNYAPNKKEQECDVLIAVGMRFSDRVISDAATYARQAKIIHLDIDKSEIGKNVRADVAVVADCKVSLPAITKLLRPACHKEWLDSFAPLYDEEYRRVIRPALYPEGGPLLMGEVVRAVSDATRGDAVLVTDVGHNQMFSCRYFRLRHERSAVSSGGLGTMGFGLPAAMGAALAAPGRTVCVFVGDGGFQMSLHELGTIMEHGIPVKIILMNNSYLGNVRQWQDMFFGGRRPFTRMANPDYSRICAAYGIPYAFVQERGQLVSRVGQMLSAAGPFVLECAVREDDFVLPMVPPGCPIDKMTLEV